MLDNIRGVIIFRAKGNKLYTFINAVRESSVVCTEQYCKNEEYFGRIYRRDLNELRQIAEEYNIEVSVLEKKGAIFKALKYKRRYGLIAGFVISCIITFYLCRVVVIIEVNGNENITYQQVITALNDVGIYKGTPFSEINWSFAEEKVKLNLGSASWVAMRHTGGRLVVDINEVDKSPQLVDSNTPCNIVASRDAQIKSVEVYCGQLNVLLSDGVKKGDVLVSGIYSDRKGNNIIRHAMAKIIGEYTVCQTFTQNFTQTGIVESQEHIKRKYLDFLGFRIPLFIGGSGLPEKFRYSESCNEFEIFGRKLPIALVYAEYIPYENVEVTYTREEAEALLNTSIHRYEKNILSDCTIISKEVEFISNDEKSQAQVTYVLQSDIAQEKSFYIGD